MSHELSAEHHLFRKGYGTKNTFVQCEDSTIERKIVLIFHAAHSNLFDVTLSLCRKGGKETNLFPSIGRFSISYERGRTWENRISRLHELKSAVWNLSLRKHTLTVMILEIDGMHEQIFFNWQRYLNPQPQGCNSVHLPIHCANSSCQLSVHKQIQN